MTESEWLTSTDPQAMMEFIRGTWCASRGDNHAADRKLRLFAVTCCHQVWHLLTDERSRNAVEVAERYADGEATEEELSAAWTAARAAAESAASWAASWAAWAAARAASWAAQSAAESAAWA